MRVGETFCDPFIEKIFKNQIFALFDQGAVQSYAKDPMMLIIVEDSYWHNKQQSQVQLDRCDTDSVLISSNQPIFGIPGQTKLMQI